MTTDTGGGKGRGEAVENYVRGNGIDCYVILDDAYHHCYNASQIEERLVNVDARVGMAEEDVVWMKKIK